LAEGVVTDQLLIAPTDVHHPHQILVGGHVNCAGEVLPEFAEALKIEPQGLIGRYGPLSPADHVSVSVVDANYDIVGICIGGVGDMIWLGVFHIGVAGEGLNDG